MSSNLEVLCLSQLFIELILDFLGNTFFFSNLEIIDFKICFSQRTKAIVDQRKLREIETQDARLAEIIQEQEKIKARRTRGRREKAASDVHPGKECQVIRQKK